MQCPNCYSSIPAAAVKCPRCDWNLQQQADSSQAASAFQAIDWDADKPSSSPWSPQSAATPDWLKPPDTSTAPPANQSGWGVPPQQDSWQQPPGQVSWSQPTHGQVNWDQPQNPTAYAGWNQPVQSPGNPNWAANPSLNQWDNASQQSPQVQMVPLQTSQKFMLLLQYIAPTILFLAILLFFMLPAFKSVGSLGFPFNLILLIFVGVLGYQVYLSVGAVRDIAMGNALVQVVRLQETKRVRNRNSTSYYGIYSQIGKVRISRNDYRNAVKGMLYTVAYSPNTKRAWNVKPEF